MPFDWITQFISETETMRSPYSFRLWTAITTIAATLERRVWTITDVDRLYPNLYVFLGGLPGSGKTLMTSYSKRVLSSVKGITFGPDQPTKEAFWERMESASKVSLNGMGVPLYSAVYVTAGEWGDFMSKYDTAFATSLSTLYDNPPNWDVPRKQAKSILLEAPTLNILAAVTPAALGDIIPEVAWGQGFTSRIIFVYGTAPQTQRSMFKKQERVDAGLSNFLRLCFNDYHGAFDWKDDAVEAMEHWYNVEKMAPIPTYGRLANYQARRDTQVMKLAMISCVSRGQFPVVELEDFLRAKSWLLETEKTMPDIFRAMNQKSDSQLIQDLYHFVFDSYMKLDKSKRVPVGEQQIWRFMENKAPSDRVQKLIAAAENSGWIKRAPGFGLWLPIAHESDATQELGDFGNPDQPYKDFLEKQRQRDLEIGEEK